jgi:hypothetical protein
MKTVLVYSLNEIRDILLKYLPPDSESYIEDALFEWARYERFIHINVDKLENISVEYEEGGLRASNDGAVPKKIQKWIDIINELILIIENMELPEEFIIDYESDISIYK